MRISIVIILLAAAVAMLYFWASPLWEDIQKSQAEKQAFESVINRINQLRKARDTLLQNYNAISDAELKRIKKIVPDTPNIGSLVVQLSNMTNESGLLLKNIGITEGDEKNGRLTLNLSIAGSYDNFTSFLEKLEKSLRLIDMGSISFSAAGEKGFYDFSLSATGYFQQTK